jgi:hypothetical protein
VVIVPLSGTWSISLDFVGKTRVWIRADQEKQI